jgi:cysteinyl-tRNA synthetase
VALAPAAVVELAQQRQHARADGDYARSDELRAAIESAGWSVRDTADGFTLTPLR